MMLFFKILCSLIILQLLYPFITVLLVQLLGCKTRHFNLPNVLPDAQALKNDISFACIITAYRNVAIARPLVESLLRQTHSNLRVYLVADECPDLDFDLADPRFMVLRPPEPLRLKAKSLLFALEHFRHPHDFVVVFDADNLVHPEFLTALSHYIKQGFQCVQGQRTAKNLDTRYAALDSLGEHYKNYLEREVPFRLGGSAVISGSGMATETGLYKAYLDSPEIREGKHQGKKMLQEDKILQNFLLRRGKRIAYAREAIVYDEKIETGEAVEIQRGRWLFSYFQNIPNALGILLKGFWKFNLNQGYFGWVTLVLPMFIQLGMAAILFLLALFFAPVWSAVLFAAIVVFIANILWVLYLDRAPPEVWSVIWGVPQFIFWQFRSLFRMRNPDKYFKHTEHRRAVSLKEMKDHKPSSGEEG